MSAIDFDSAFAKLTGNSPFPWQRDLYESWFSKGKFPDACILPTGLGKTSVIAVWLIALAHAPSPVPRRLVYVVNRRTVVDQTTTEAEKMRKNAEVARVPVPSISTLRGQFADNREWSADPSKPAIIVGTVDMIGSRLLFSGYGIGFKSRPLHAGFLGQDALLVHDEAHLEKPFQDLLEAIECEQRRAGAAGRGPDFRPFRVMALTATPRGGDRPFELTKEERNPPEVFPEDDIPLHTAWRRLRAKKTLSLSPAVSDEKQVVPAIVESAWQRGQSHPDTAILVFVRTVEAVTEVAKGLRAKKVPERNISTLTGTMRGLERNRQADPRQQDADPVFARFLKPPMPGEGAWKISPQSGTVYLVCTAAGEVGVDISADHLVCDLTPFDSMAQRFGRVNRYGVGDARIDVIHEGKPSEKKQSDPYDQRRWLSLTRLDELDGDASPHAIAGLPLEDRVAAFTPPPTVLPTSDLLFDAWAMTTIRGKLPGRPMVEPYLHGVSGWEPPETRVAWREEVGVVTEELLTRYKPDELLEDYPLKAHELLRDNSIRVFDRVKKLKAEKATAVWVVSEDGTVGVTTLGELIEAGREEIERKTVLLPPSAGGLRNGMLAAESTDADDVGDDLFDKNEKRRRVRARDDDPDYKGKTAGMRLIRRIDLSTADQDEDQQGRSWDWFELPAEGETDGSKTASAPITWTHHTTDVENGAKKLADALLNDQPGLHQALVLAARFHDLGKKRVVWQRSIGNPTPTDWYAKSGVDPRTNRAWKPLELTDYRHEFGSLLDIRAERQFAELEDDHLKDLILHLIAVHHGYGRPHFPPAQAFDPNATREDASELAAEIPRRYARLQRRYGRWGLAYLESLLRAADYAASAKPSPLEDQP